MKARSLLTQLQSAFNTHDIHALEECFAREYHSDQPVHPNRGFDGRQIMADNWSSNFKEMPDFSATLVSSVVTPNEIWAEWEWKGTRQDKSELHMKGVTIFGIAEEKIQWAKLYVEPVEKNSLTITAAVREVMHGKATPKKQ